MHPSNAAIFATPNSLFDFTPFNGGDNNNHKVIKSALRFEKQQLEDSYFNFEDTTFNDVLTFEEMLEYSFSSTNNDINSNTKLDDSNVIDMSINQAYSAREVVPTDTFNFEEEFKNVSQFFEDDTDIASTPARGSHTTRKVAGTITPDSADSVSPILAKLHRNEQYMSGADILHIYKESLKNTSMIGMPHDNNAGNNNKSGSEVDYSDVEYIPTNSSSSSSEGPSSMSYRSKTYPIKKANPKYKTKEIQDTTILEEIRKEESVDDPQREIIFKQAKPVKCGKCSKWFQSKHHTDRHNISVHLNERNYACTLCEKRFKRFEHLQVHFKSIHQMIAKRCKKEKSLMEIKPIEKDKKKEKEEPPEKEQSDKLDSF